MARVAGQGREAQKEGQEVKAPRRKYSEHAEQAALIRWVRLHEQIEPRLKLLYAIPNGEARSARAGARLKAEGVRAGVPDLCLPVNCRDLSALYIEMKAPGGRQSKAQIEWAALASRCRNHVEVCTSWTQAAIILCIWCDNPALKVPR
jgi:hypothetical protein